MSATAELHDVGAGQPRRHPRRRIALAGLLVLLAVGGMEAWRTTRSTGHGHRLIYTQTLPDGRVFRCFSDGSAIGSAGTEVALLIDRPRRPAG